MRFSGIDFRISSSDSIDGRSNDARSLHVAQRRGEIRIARQVQGDGHFRSVSRRVGQRGGRSSNAMSGEEPLDHLFQRLDEQRECGRVEHERNESVVHAASVVPLASIALEHVDRRHRRFHLVEHLSRNVRSSHQTVGSVVFGQDPKSQCRIDDRSFAFVVDSTARPALPIDRHRERPAENVDQTRLDARSIATDETIGPDHRRNAADPPGNSTNDSSKSIRSERVDSLSPLLDEWRDESAVGSECDHGHVDSGASADHLGHTRAKHLG